MRIRCVATQPNAEQRRLLGGRFREGQRYPIEKGKAYTPLGIGYEGGVTWVEIAENERVVAPVPLFLFEVLEGTASRHWCLRLQPEGASTLWPALFYERAFHDRLVNGDPDLLERFRELRTELEAEYAVAT